MKSALWVLTGAVLAGLPAACGGENAEDAPARPTLEFYDVHSLTERPKDLLGPDWQWCVPGANGSVQVAYPFVAQPAPEITIQTVADMLRNRVRPDSWDANLGTSIEERGGMLVIVQKPSVHALIRKMLAAFEQDTCRQAAVQALLVDVEPAALAPFLGQAGRSFGDDAVRGALEKGALRFAPQVLARNGQRQHTLSGTQHAFLADYEVSGDSLDPVVRQICEGVLLDVYPLFSHDRRQATVDLRLTLNDRVAFEKSSRLSASGVAGPSTPLPNPAGRAQEPGARKEGTQAPGEPEPERNAHATVPSGAEPGKLFEARYEIEKPVVSGRQLQQSFQVDVGRWTLAGILPPAEQPGDGRAARSTLVFLLVNEVQP